MWIGVITKAWIWLMEWGGITDNCISEYIREIRQIIYTFAKETWKVRCEAVYSPGEEKKRRKKRDTNEMYKSYIRKMKKSNKINITHLINMTMKERTNLMQRREFRNQWKQSSLESLEFCTEN